EPYCSGSRTGASDCRQVIGGGRAPAGQAPPSFARSQVAKTQGMTMDAQPVAGASERPSIALALGGGAARGIAHIAMLEAFDELGIRPSVIAGCSIGAVIGACYAAGLSAKEIRTHLAPLVVGRRA